MSKLPGMTLFWERFPDVAARETRVVTLPCTCYGLPAGNYGFLELYCDELQALILRDQRVYRSTGCRYIGSKTSLASLP